MATTKFSSSRTPSEPLSEEPSIESEIITAFPPCLRSEYEVRGRMEMSACRRSPTLELTNSQAEVHCRERQYIVPARKPPVRNRGEVVLADAREEIMEESFSQVSASVYITTTTSPNLPPSSGHSKDTAHTAKLTKDFNLHPNPQPKDRSQREVIRTKRTREAYWDDHERTGGFNRPEMTMNMAPHPEAENDEALDHEGKPTGRLFCCC